MGLVHMSANPNPQKEKRILLRPTPNGDTLFCSSFHLVWARHTIIWTDQDHPTGKSARRETKRQTEETMGRQHLKSGLALNGIYYYGKLRTTRSGGSWL